MHTFYGIALTLLFSVQLISQVSSPVLYPEKSFHNDSLYVIISTNDNSEIHYTTDGSQPVYESLKYVQPILINKTTVIRARSFISDTLYSKVSTRTYFINEQTTLPVISLSTNPANFFDSRTGIYVHPTYDWEYPIHIEMYEEDRSEAFSIDAGVKIFGEGSATFPQKSLVVFARNKYGTGKIRYKIFSDTNVDEFESIILRNGGSDWNKSMLRDGFIQYVVKDLNVDRQAYRAAVMFLNGEYWGIHNIRERSDETFIESHHNVPRDSIDLIKYWFAVNGTTSHYSMVKNYIKQHDMSLQENYAYIQTGIDIDAFLNYITTEIYFDNTDWPGNNIKFWHPQRPGGKWRWLLYDLDSGLDLRERESYKHPSLTFVTSGNGIDYHYPDWGNEILNGLLKNQQFRFDLINRLADLSNSIFIPGNLLNILKDFTTNLEPEIPRHFERWDTSVTNWYKHIELIKTFLNNRIPYIQQDYINLFKLTGITKINLNINQHNTGRIKLNSLDISAFPWSGEFFSGVPVKITAVPEAGYKFLKWEEINSDAEITIVPDSLPSKLTAVFKPDTGYSAIVINEINYNSAPEFDTEDWLELYNSGSNTVDVSGWILKDSDDMNRFIFPQNILMAPHSYLVLCRDTSRFRGYFPAVTNITGNFGFGLNNGGELIRLYNQHLTVMDSLTYDDAAPWPTQADGSGATLELVNPVFNNSDPGSWGVSPLYGTPGKANSFYTAVEEEDLIPEEIILYQNYPNPFNSSTTITYSLADPGDVEISIYDLLGRETAVIERAEKNAGIYRINYSPGNLSSGVYYIRMRTGNNVKTSKMLLLK